MPPENEGGLAATDPNTGVLPVTSGDKPAGGDTAPAAAVATEGADSALPPAAGGEDRGGSAPPAAPTGGEATKPDWREARIAKLTAQLKQAREAAQQPPVGAEPPGMLPEAEIERRAALRAQQIAENSRFSDQCAEVARTGKAAFPDFDQRIQQFSKLVPAGDNEALQAYSNLVTAAIKTGDAHVLLHRLGGDLNEAARLLALPPVDQALELVKMKGSAGPTVSDVPKPITPLGGNKGNTRELIDPADASRADQLSTAEWIARRNEQVAKRQGRAVSSL
jgi:hypothetical protein